MDETGFLELADELSMGSRQADWRSAISRAYYAAFHKARSILFRAGFRTPDGERAHAYLWMRLSNTGHPDVNDAGGRLSRLRALRNWADYDFSRPVDEASAILQVQIATNIMELLDDLAKEATILARVVEAIKVYERDVLREVTWQP
jgi:uncharacterized protein (UPF0332 family)